MIDERPPHNLDVEAAVLSALLWQPTLLDDVRATLNNGAALWAHAHQHIFRAVCDLADAGTAIDVTTVAQQLKAHDRLTQIGGTPYLAQLLSATPTSSNTTAHATMLRDLWRMREAMRTAKLMIADAQGQLGDAEQIQQRLEKFEAEIGELAHEQSRRTLRTFGEIAGDVHTLLQRTKDEGAKVTGTTTGFADLDKKTTGGHAGDLFVIAGRPGMGKTSVALGMAMKIAQSGSAVPFFSLEMPAEQLVIRILSAELSIGLQAIREGSLSQAQLDQIKVFGEDNAALPLFVDDSSSITPLEMRARVRKLQREIEGGKYPNVTRCGGMFVDYVQLVRPSAHTGSREQDVASIARNLKQTAKELATPVYALAQLNREVEKRNDKRPQLSDLRESGAIEQDADTVIFVHRPAYYDKGNDASLKGWAELIIAKQRNGPTCSVKLAFSEDFARFDNFADGYNASSWGGRHDDFDEDLG